MTHHRLGEGKGGQRTRQVGRGTLSPTVSLVSPPAHSGYSHHGDGALGQSRHWPGDRVPRAQDDAQGATHPALPTVTASTAYGYSLHHLRGYRRPTVAACGYSLHCLRSPCARWDTEGRSLPLTGSQPPIVYVYRLHCLRLQPPLRLLPEDGRPALSCPPYSHPSPPHRRPTAAPPPPHRHPSPGAPLS